MTSYEIIDEVLSKNKIIRLKDNKVFTNIACLKDFKGNFWFEGYLGEKEVIYDCVSTVKSENKIIKIPTATILGYFKLNEKGVTWEVLGND